MPAYVSQVEREEVAYQHALDVGGGNWRASSRIACGLHAVALLVRGWVSLGRWNVARSVAGDCTSRATRSADTIPFVNQGKRCDGAPRLEDVGIEYSQLTLGANPDTALRARKCIAEK